MRRQYSKLMSHQDVLAAELFIRRSLGVGGQTVEVMTSIGLVTYYVLFFMHIDTRRVHIAGITPYPDESWMKQIARNSERSGESRAEGHARRAGAMDGPGNITMSEWGFLENRRYIIIDRDSKYAASFRAILKSSGLKIIRLPPYSPDLNAYCERWVLSVKSEILNRLVIFGEDGLRRALSE